MNEFFRQMMWTLRAQSIRYRDRVLEGIPSQNMLVSFPFEQDLSRKILAVKNSKPFWKSTSFSFFYHIVSSNMCALFKKSKNLNLLFSQTIISRKIVLLFCNAVRGLITLSLFLYPSYFCCSFPSLSFLCQYFSQVLLFFRLSQSAFHFPIL